MSRATEMLYELNRLVEKHNGHDDDGGNGDDYKKDMKSKNGNGKGMPPWMNKKNGNGNGNGNGDDDDDGDHEYDDKGKFKRNGGMPVNDKKKKD